MVKSFLVDDKLYGEFVEAVGNAYNGKARGNISEEHRNALRNHIKLLNGL